jgi:hypothetical protein
LRHVAPKIRHVSYVGWKLVLTQRVEEKVEGMRECWENAPRWS